VALRDRKREPAASRRCAQPALAPLAPANLLRCLDPGAPHHRGGTLATYKELADFLAEVERRAYKQALFAVRDDHLALDIVQDAMLKLSERYSARPPAELPLLFQRILQNTIRDFYRRQKVRSIWTTPVSSLLGGDAEEDADPLETLEVADDSQFSQGPAEQMERGQVLGLIEKALEKLPARQRQAFLLRYWEELDVAQAAKVMGCSEGSVKTHCSRATHALAVMLKKQGITL
jgi:RNA polymerase sigma-70 factor (ECF subfamily)